jgi:hypothetical protein
VYTSDDGGTTAAQPPRISPSDAVGLADLLAHVRRRYDHDATAADPLTARWAQTSLALLDEMERHLSVAPPSGFETQRFLLRAAALDDGRAGQGTHRLADPLA